MYEIPEYFFLCLKIFITHSIKNILKYCSWYRIQRLEAPKNFQFHSWKMLKLDWLGLANVKMEKYVKVMKEDQKHF